MGRGHSEVVPGDKDVAEDRDFVENRDFVEDKNMVDCTQVQEGRLAAWKASQNKES
jgi:hypothetical protein